MKKIIIFILILAVILPLGYLAININNNKEHKTTNISNEKNDKEKNNNSDKNLFVTTNLKDKIYLVKESGKKTDIFDISDYKNGFSYCIDNNKLYLHLNSELGYIDLSDENYKYIKINELEHEYPKSIAVINDTIYYVTSTNNIFRYNIKSKEKLKLDEEPFNSVNYLYKLNDNTLAYFKAATMISKPEIGIINVDNNNKYILDENANIEYIYNNELIYRKNEDNNNWTYFKYDVKNNTHKKISDSTYSSENLYASFIIPFNDYFIYVNKSKIYRYKNDKSEEIYSLEYNIDSINLISNNSINIFSYGDMNNAVNINLNINTLKEKTENEEKRYYNIIYINKTDF